MVDISGVLKRIFAKPELQNAGDLRKFLESRSAFLVQKSITEYSQARANMMFSTLLTEKGFQDAFEAARWKAFPAGLAMVGEILHGALRARGQAPVTAADAVATAAQAIVEPYVGASGLEVAYWDSALADLRRAMAQAALGPPHPAHTVVKPRAQDIFNALPFHSAIRAHDFEMFQNTLAFHLTSIAAELEGMQIALPRPEEKA